MPPPWKAPPIAATSNISRDMRSFPPKRPLHEHRVSSVQSDENSSGPGHAPHRQIPSCARRSPPFFRCAFQRLTRTEIVHNGAHRSRLRRRLFTSTKKKRTRSPLASTDPPGTACSGMNPSIDELAHVGKVPRPRPSRTDARILGRWNRLAKVKSSHFFKWGMRRKAEMLR